MIWPAEMILPRRDFHDYGKCLNIHWTITIRHLHTVWFKTFYNARWLHVKSSTKKQTKPWLCAVIFSEVTGKHPWQTLLIINKKSIKQLKQFKAFIIVKIYGLASVKEGITSALNVKQMLSKYTLTTNTDIQTLQCSLYLSYNLKYLLHFDFTAPVRRPNHSWEEADQKTHDST